MKLSLENNFIYILALVSNCFSGVLRTYPKSHPEHSVILSIASS